ncbi:MAG: bifunctional methylenetetrahydrofolate dehydrogenase/methenyltetrahydrofolate cyclohydrolase FolD [Oscillospiraceae bacterium]|nr:bifunctional methylenetetrahydrofolate dehydrogenase/methenyltetrahydrofolate cyclohydrolase FolD [Oscillospiraceae bacterium]
MSAVVMDGKALAAKVKARALAAAGQLERQPGLAVILVGENPASQVYVRGKVKDCADCGIACFDYYLPADTTEEQLLALVAELNDRSDVDGILCQLPLPGHIAEKKVLEAISPDKDVDAFHPYSMGRILRGDPCFLPCTPAGVMELLHEYGIEVAGKKCVVVGRSNIVGKPMALLLLGENGTVTVCHSRTPDLKAECLQADILVAAVGKVNLITADMVKEGAVVIDVAMNRNAEGKLCGDVDYPAVAEKASFITPVPGGVGPMTRAMLMENTLAAAKARQ